MYNKSLWLAGLGLFLLSCLAIDLVADIERSRLDQMLQTRVAGDVSRLVSQLEKELNSNVYLVNGLVAYIYAEPELDEDKIQVALKALHDFGTHLRNVAAAPDNRLTYLYPLAGNEKAVGVSYRDVPAQWPAVERAIKSGETLVTGPVELIQGGTGIVSRTPVFLADGSYWGLLSLVMDVDSLLQGAGIAPEVRYLKLAIRTTEEGIGAGGMIMGDPALFESDAVVQPIVIPGGEWQLAAMPIDGSHAPQTLVTTMEGVAMALALCFILGLVRIQHIQRRIAAAKNRMETILDTTQDAIIVFDDTGRVSESNPAAERLFGYSRVEMKHLNITTFMRRANRSGSATGHVLEINGDRPEHISDIEAVTQNGKIIPLELNIGHTMIDGINKHICAARDISVRKAAEEILMELAATDELTGVMNRRSVMKSAAEMFAMGRRHNRPLAIMMIDADHFKYINDTYGHDTGDKVLVALAACVRGNLRTTDLLGRFGGEEFIVVMPEATLEEAESVATRMLERIRALRVTTAADTQINFTVSIGISSMDANTAQLAEMIQLADTALYASKNAGRDRYSIVATAGQERVQKTTLSVTGLQDLISTFEKKAL